MDGARSRFNQGDVDAAVDHSTFLPLASPSDPLCLRAPWDASVWVTEVSDGRRLFGKTPGGAPLSASGQLSRLPGGWGHPKCGQAKRLQPHTGGGCHSISARGLELLPGSSRVGEGWSIDDGDLPGLDGRPDAQAPADGAAALSCFACAEVPPPLVHTGAAYGRCVLPFLQ